MGPPSSQPVPSTATSRAIRIGPTGLSSTRLSPVISPSRAPGPSWAPMYMAAVMPLTITPTTIIADATARFGAAGISAIPISMLTPTHRAFRTVPMPTRWRRGMKASSTTKLTVMLRIPTVEPMRSARAACSTSHGAPPSPERSSRARDRPKPVRPTISSSSLEGRRSTRSWSRSERFSRGVRTPIRSPRAG